MDWRDICHQKFLQRNAQIPENWKIKDVPSLNSHFNLQDVPDSCGILSPREIEITTKNDAVDLVDKIAAQIYSAEEVTRAFCKRAAIAQSLVNCLTEVFFDEAIERACQLDKERAANPGQPLRPFHGLPVSLKDSFNVTGKDASIGLVHFVNKPSASNSPMVDYLIYNGAIPYCKTNVPQTLMTADSDNNIFGRTLNPCNTTLTAGGSTGGEGALIALRGSVLGIGTDVAGSIRIPSLCNGIYGFKPSADITPYSGQQSPVAPGIPGITPSAGPMATSARACRFFMETVMRGAPSDFDCSCINVRWFGESLPHRPLRIGIWQEDGMYTPTPPMRRALQESMNKLVGAGMECIPIQISGVAAMMRDIWDLYSLDGAKFTRDLIASTEEPFTPSVQATDLVSTPAKSMERLFELNVAQGLARKTVHKLWKENNLDCILTLPAPHTALPLDKWSAVTYTCIFNYLDYPAIVIPVGRVQISDLKDEEAKFGEVDAEVYDIYSGPKDFADAPIAVQLVGYRQHDEELLNIAERVDSIINHR